MDSYLTCIEEKNPDFNKFISFLEQYVIFLNNSFGFNIDTIIFIVHEPPEIPCGERPILKEWFKRNGLELNEWIKEN